MIPISSPRPVNQRPRRIYGFFSADLTEDLSVRYPSLSTLLPLATGRSIFDIPTIGRSAVFRAGALAFMLTKRLRLQILDGRPRSPLLDFPPQDCILNRLQKLLIWLARRHPEQGWSAFLNGDEPRWDRIAAAGHSQGGGHAAMMGKELPLERVVMLSAPADCIGSGEEPAPWLRRRGATPPENYFGFSHLRDPAIGRILSAWEALGLAAFGPVTKVDTSPPPFGNSHRLVTNQEVPGDRHHGSVAADRFIPRFERQHARCFMKCGPSFSVFDERYLRSLCPGTKEVSCPFAGALGT